MLTALLMHAFLPAGFSNRQLREAVAQLMQTDGYGTGQATCDLRRLRLRGLIERLSKSHRYRITERGHRIALAYCRIHRRTLTPTLAAAFDESMPTKLGPAAQSAASTSRSAGSGPRSRSRPNVAPVENLAQMVRLCV